MNRVGGALAPTCSLSPCRERTRSAPSSSLPCVLSTRNSRNPPDALMAWSHRGTSICRHCSLLQAEQRRVRLGQSCSFRRSLTLVIDLSISCRIRSNYCRIRHQGRPPAAQATHADTRTCGHAPTHTDPHTPLKGACALATSGRIPRTVRYPAPPNTPGYRTLCGIPPPAPGGVPHNMCHPHGPGRSLSNVA